MALLTHQFRIFLSFLALFSLVACGGGPQTYYYVLQAPPAVQKMAVPPISAVLGVEAFTADLPFQDNRIVYRDSPYEVHFYHYQRWIAPPPQLVAEAVRNGLKAAGLFQQVVEWPSVSRVDYILRGRVKSLEEWDEEKAWYGKVAIHFQLYDNRNKLVWEEEISHRTAAESKSPLAVVKAINQSLDKVIQEAVEKLSEKFSH